MKSTWDPDQYEKFKAQRKLPFNDLKALIQPQPGMRILDLGCGTGALTRELHDELGAASTLGIDSATTMLEKSGEFATDTLRFQEGRIEDFAPEGSCDLVFSNAALHFVPGHHVLFAKLKELLRPGGQLAVHLPANHTFHTHVIAAELGAREPYASALGGENYASAVLEPREYALTLHALGFTDPVVRLNVYTHELPDWEAVYEWVKGSLLTWYERRLPGDLFAQFVEDYRNELHRRLGDARPFIFTFNRILLWGRLVEDKNII